ncbi:MAG: aspartate ammonia-lyase [Clostridia bacterium]|nr:aspartate ammonia-lyase [Clostridia bacterium]
MTSFRIEHDFVGEKAVPQAAYYGIHSLRAQENFPITGQRLCPEMIIALANVKKACALANQEAGVLSDSIAEAIIKACDEVACGCFHEQFIVDPIQGGAGTSTNMNANEVIANRAIELLGGALGDYALVNPNDHVNCGQSTNDVYPTCGKLALYRLSQGLLTQLERLIDALSAKAAAFDHVVKMGRTQLQDAVPIRLGQEFAAYVSVLRREAARLDKARQELLCVNLGGTAIGTSVNADPVYIRTVVPKLAQITGLPFIQSDDLIDATQNLDCYVTFSSALKSCGVSLSKICNDLRLMSSGPQDGLGEITLPPRQNGSSIMPGKVNPVIPEVVNQIAFRLIGFDTTITLAAEAGQFELNAFEPVIFDTLLSGVQQLTQGLATLTDHCILGITANPSHCQEEVERSVGIVTALCPLIGYSAACSLAKEALRTRTPIRELVVAHGLLTPQQAEQALEPRNMT